MTDRHQNLIAGRAVDPPFKSDTALLLIDLISDFEFEDGERLWKNTRPIGEPLARLLSRARDRKIPVVYVNDNFGNWQEDLEKQIERILSGSGMGRELIEKIGPSDADIYVLKPQRSAFYETPLSVLLSGMGVKKLIITGITTDICVLFTAHDAYMRGFDILVPHDCTAAVEAVFKQDALALLERVAKADTRPSTDLEF